MNALISDLQREHPDVINRFLERLSLCRKRGNMPGLLLNGKQISKIIREDSLMMLSDMLTEINSKFLISVDYLRSLKDLHVLMVSKSLDPNFPTIIQRFRDRFNDCFNLGLIRETPKCHLLLDHLEDHMVMTNETLWYADTSGKINCCQARVQVISR